MKIFKNVPKLILLFLVLLVSSFCFGNQTDPKPKVVSSNPASDKSNTKSNATLDESKDQANPKISSGNEGAHGGSDIALEFKLSAMRAIYVIQSSDLESTQDLKTHNLIYILDNSKVYVVDEPLLINLGDFHQSSVAISFPHKSEIYINKSLWNEIKNQDIKEALALHEVLVLAGLETTGVYTYSQYFLALVSKCESGVGFLDNSFCEIQSELKNND